MELIITTAKGANIRLHAMNGHKVSADINGKPHSAAGSVKFGNDAEAGDHIALAGKLRAPIKADDVAAVKAFFAAADIAHKAQIASDSAAYVQTAEYHSDLMRARMYGGNSNH